MRILYAASLALMSTMAIAQTPATPPPAASSAVTGGSYVADPLHTLIVWTVDHLGITPYSGILGDITGTLQLDPKNLNAAKVDITIPISKIVTASSDLTKHLLRDGKEGAKPDFFGASPADARFVSTSVEAVGQEATIHGKLTLNGVTHPVSLKAKFYGAAKAPKEMGGKENVGFSATTTIKRSQFGLGYGVPMVGDDVKLDIVAAFAAAN